VREAGAKHRPQPKAYAGTKVPKSRFDPTTLS
jgi:hypothetical protein